MATEKSTAASTHLDPKTTWVLLWSQQQCAMHVEPLHRMYESHAEAFREDQVREFIPLIIGSRAEVDEMAELIRPTLRARDEARSRGSKEKIPFIMPKQGVEEDRED